MAADVSSTFPVQSGYREEKHRTLMGDESNGQDSTTLITRDLLGGSLSSVEPQELDLDLQVPTGWEKRLDLKSGKVYIQKSNTLSSFQVSEQKMANSTVPKLEDLHRTTPSELPARVFDEINLELKLVSSSVPSRNYQSVCTLDKVKSALERAEKDPIKKRSSSYRKPLLSSPSPSYSSSSSSLKENQEDDKEKMISSPMAAGCPGCLSYILITKHNPICPRCNSVVPFPLTKKPRIDLNM